VMVHLQRPTVCVMEAIIKGLQQLRHRQLTLVQLQLRNNLSANDERKSLLQTARGRVAKGHSTI
jgi:hypothetical protein